MAPVGCRTLVCLPRAELPVLLADEEVAEETEDTPAGANVNAKLCGKMYAYRRCTTKKERESEL